MYWIAKLVDNVKPSIRSKIMASIKAKNSKPEMIVRKGLFSRGFRYGLHNRKLPGSPDLVFSKYSAVIFVHGCFWHSHNCHLSRLPKSNIEFWGNKLLRNSQRDNEVTKKLNLAGWKVGFVWECSLRGKTKFNFEDLLDVLEKWLHSSTKNINIPSIPIQKISE